METEKKAERVLRTFTAPWEKPLLIRMAKALPAWVTSDHLTVLAVIASFITGLGFYLLRFSRWWILLSNAGFVIHWWGDSLDGTLARVRHKEREKFGFFVDHICDAWAVVVICTGLGLSPIVRLDLALFVAIAYLLMNIFAHVLTYVQRVFKLSYGRFGPTEVRIIMMAVTTLLTFWNPVIFRVLSFAFTLGDFILLALSAVLVAIFILSSVLKAIELDRLDRAAGPAAVRASDNTSGPDRP